LALRRRRAWGRGALGGGNGTICRSGNFCSWGIFVDDVVLFKLPIGQFFADPAIFCPPGRPHDPGMGLAVVAPFPDHVACFSIDFADRTT